MWQVIVIDYICTVIAPCLLMIISILMGMHIGTTALGATADHYEKQHSSTRNSYVPGVNSVQDFSILH